MPFLDPKYEKDAKLRVQRRPKQLAVINQGGCTGCMVCVDFCPVDCIELVPGPDPDNRNVHKLVEVDLPLCIGCTLCAKYCPWDTIEMFLLITLIKSLLIGHFERLSKNSGDGNPCRRHRRFGREEEIGRRKRKNRNILKPLKFYPIY